MIVEITPERAIEIVEKISRFIVNRKMAAPAIMTIESLRPLHNIGSQLLYFVAPFAEVIFNAKEYEEFAALLEKDEYVKLLLKRMRRICIAHKINTTKIVLITDNNIFLSNLIFNLTA